MTYRGYQEDHRQKILFDFNKMCRTGTDLFTLQRDIQNDLDLLMPWCCKNNSAKTNIIVFGRKHAVNATPPPDINVQGEKLKLVKTYNYHGFTLDYGLSLGVQTACVKKGYFKKSLS